MRGTIISVQGNAGIISGYDGARYAFVRLDWQNQQVAPAGGMEVDFVAEGEQAKNIYMLAAAPAKNMRWILAIVCFFLGMLGVHRFMVGKTGSGIVMLILTLTVIGSIVSGIWSLVDLIIILTGNFTDKNGNKIID